jgi:hypothetical protein
LERGRIPYKGLAKNTKRQIFRIIDKTVYIIQNLLYNK